MSDRPHLRSLSRRIGILPKYVDIQRNTRVTKDATRAAILNAIGFDVSTEKAAADAIDILDRSERERLLPPVRVVTAPKDQPLVVRLNIPGTRGAPVEWWIELIEENGAKHVASGRAVPGENDSSTVTELPCRPPIGYHTLHVRVGVAGNLLEAEQLLVVSPGRCFALAEHMGDQRPFGVWCNLYSVRSERNWGIGDLTDMKTLACGFASRRAAFAGINPLHALRNKGHAISPYSPVSRLFRNPVYLDIEAVPELVDCPVAHGRLQAPKFRSELENVRAATHVDYERVVSLKLEIMRLLHEEFRARHQDGHSDRGAAYQAYVRNQGQPLIDFATFAALGERITTRTGPRHGASLSAAGAHQRRDSKDIETFRTDHQADIAFHCYVQFELDRQLGVASQEIRRAGMPLGLYQDLAIGSAADGADAWAFPGLFVYGLEMGAPPDPYSDVGQTWGVPPIDPRALQAGKYEYWTTLLQSTLAHTGMLRIDHVMGLFRQFWVPRDSSAAEGAYVEYPADDLLGILALESHRHGTAIVGEDLGTVPPEIPPTLAKWGILSSRVMYFEKDDSGAFKDSQSYDANALVTSTTHDHPPLAGFWSGRDLTIRREIGLLESQDELAEAQVERQKTREGLTTRLIAEGILEEDAEVSFETLNAAVHTFLARTPAAVLGLSLDDLAGETDPVNIPGVTPPRYPCWSRRMQRTIEDVLSDPNIDAILADVRRHLDNGRLA